MRAAVCCPMCGTPAPLLYDGCRDLEYFVEASSRFHRCGRCRLVFMHPRPTRAELPTLYPSTYQNFDPPANPISRFLLDRYYEHQCATCRRHLPAGGALLEVGCAAGDILHRMRQQGYEVQGVDVSREACERARQRGLDVFCGTVDELETDDRFDLVFMSHVIEHVIDPVATIAKVSSLLKPGGVLYLETPNVGSLDARLFRERWGLIHYPRHLYLFDRATVQRLLECGGLSDVRVSWEINSCGWALSVQSALRRMGADRSRRPRSFYYPLLLLLLLPMNVLDVGFGGTAFMSATARKSGD
jgi:2-polyprenyl-3-methyl-5-hydroxy-6-metoxy-1,4-benzoquinol methylase